MVVQEINTQALLFPCSNYRPVSIWQVKKKNGVGLGAYLSICFVPLSVGQWMHTKTCHGGAEEDWICGFFQPSCGDEPLVKLLCPPCATALKWPNFNPIPPRQMDSSFTARMRKQCGIWQRQWLPALCRTPPARSPPPEASHGRCYNDKRQGKKWL